MNKNIIYTNGIFSKENKASISPLNRGIMYGDGVFETFRGYYGKIFALDEHYIRLQRSASFLKINLPFSSSELRDLIAELLDKNSLKDKDSRIRLTLIRGTGKEGLFPDPGAKSEIIITAEEVSPYIELIQKKGVKLTLIEGTRIDRLSPLASHKTLNYISGVLALDEVREKGGDEGVYLNHEQNVVEGITSNIFMVKNGRVKTPPLSSGLLPGITRDTVLKCADICEIAVEKIDIKKEDLLNADEIFITSSVREVVPAIKFEEKIFNVGAITKKLQLCYKQFITNNLQ